MIAAAVVRSAHSRHPVSPQRFLLSLCGLHQATKPSRRRDRNGLRSGIFAFPTALPQRFADHPGPGGTTPVRLITLAFVEL